MPVLWDNPVARHAGRLASRRGWPLVVLALLLVTGVVGAMLERHWMEMDEYSFMKPQSATRTVATTLLGETLVALPWAAVRGALLWRRLKGDGHLDEYRRSRMSAGSITAGALIATLFPVLALIGLSLAIFLTWAWFSKGLLLSEVVWAHGLLVTQALAFAALGLWLSGLVRYPGLAIPLALAALAAAVGAIWAIDGRLRTEPDAPTLIYRALLPNPVTAIGNALNTDVLRFSWIYERIHAHEYFFVYPPAWQTGGLYIGIGAVLSALIAFRVSRAG